MEHGWFDGVDDVVHDDLRFKAKLGIGENAYTSVRVKKALFEAWDVAGVAATGAQVASSAMIAQKFFAAPSLLAAIGIGTATAATPVGWIAAASVISGGAWLGITRYLKSDNSKTTVIPTFINTPLDVLGLGIFDLLAPLAMKVAQVDGKVEETEEAAIRRYFVEEWGYSEQFAERGFEFVKLRLDEYNIKATAQTLGAFTRDNPDCSFDHMYSDIMTFLQTVAEADGILDEREEMALERISKVFAEEGKFSVSRTVAPVGNAIGSAAASVGSVIGSVPSQVARLNPLRRTSSEGEEIESDIGTEE
ncbi:TerB family tellurite resistance protein [Ruegeria lacuscaerulensis]|uniref:TerB family tellurite resistance protein n=1 Tax=Ruegeria lacuscaerulensis TaxID=55218 RepID=UPI001479D0B7|nr:TerB family tellurite resistance protein [Ruegeria lacuscaerulensis]